MLAVYYIYMKRTILNIYQVEKNSDSQLFLDGGYRARTGKSAWLDAGMPHLLTWRHGKVQNHAMELQKIYKTESKFLDRLQFCV